MIPDKNYFDDFDIKYGPPWCSYGSLTRDVDITWFLEYVVDVILDDVRQLVEVIERILRGVSLDDDLAQMLIFSYTFKIMDTKLLR